MLKAKNYIDEILRFCRTLTQMKYDASDDKMLKNFIAENLNALSSFPSWSKNEYVNEILWLCDGLVKAEFQSEVDKDIKSKIAFDLALFSADSIQLAKLKAKEHEQKKVLEHRSAANNITFIDKIEQIRRFHDWSRKELAEHYKVAPSTVTRWFTGVQTPGGQLFLQLNQDYDNIVQMGV